MTEIEKANDRENLRLSQLRGLFGADREDLKPLFEIDLGGVPLGMSPFQIQHFVLNRKEFPSDFAQFQQSKIELWHRVNSLFDFYFSFREANAKIKLLEREIELLKEKDLDPLIREAEIELKAIEIEKYKFQILNLKKMATDKINEALCFYTVYKKLQKFDSLPPEQLALEEEESWRQKAKYFPELLERYGLTPQGFVPPAPFYARLALPNPSKKLPKGLRGRR